MKKRALSEQAKNFETIILYFRRPQRGIKPRRIWTLTGKLSRDVSIIAVQYVSKTDSSTTNFAIFGNWCDLLQRPIGGAETRLSCFEEGGEFFYANLWAYDLDGSGITTLSNVVDFLHEQFPRDIHWLKQPKRLFYSDV